MLRLNLSLLGSAAVTPTKSRAPGAGFLADILKNQVNPNSYNKGVPAGSVVAAGRPVHRAAAARLTGAPEKAAPLSSDEQIVPDGVVVESWEQVLGYVTTLKARIVGCDNLESYGRFVDDYTYLSSWVDEYVTWAQHNQRQATFDTALQDKWKLMFGIYRQFQASSEEIIKLLGDSKFYSQLTKLDPVKYAAFTRIVNDLKSAAVKSGSTERTAWGEAQGKYQASLVSKVLWQEKEVSVAEITAALKSKDALVCSDAWMSRAKAYLAKLADADAATTDVLNQLWALAGEATPLKWLEGETGYSASQARDLLATVHEAFVPLYRDIIKARRVALGVSEYAFMPWDVQRTPVGLEPLSAYETAAEFQEKAIAIATRIHPEFGALTQSMFENGQISSDSRADKFPRAYIAMMPLSGTTVVSVITNGTPHSLNTNTIHELGHAWHLARSAKAQSSALNGVAGFHHFRGLEQVPLETFSVTMEALGALQSDLVYESPADQARAKEEQIFTLLNMILRQCVVAEYEMWLYSSRDALDADTRSAFYKTCLKKYGLYENNWDSMDRADRETVIAGILAERLMLTQDAVLKPMTGLWFYGVNGLAAIQVLQRVQDEGFEAAVSGLLPAMDAGASLGFEETWKLAGLNPNLNPAEAKKMADTIRALM